MPWNFTIKKRETLNGWGTLASEIPRYSALQETDSFRLAQLLNTKSRGSPLGFTYFLSVIKLLQHQHLRQLI
jgi:hypothetical protein